LRDKGKIAMSASFWQKLGALLLPERYTDQQTTPFREPVDALLFGYEQLLRLATQFDMHADLAPYPYVAANLRKMATENRDAAERFRTVLEQQRRWISTPPTVQARGKNHWERLQHDLADQKLFDNYLAINEAHLGAQYPDFTEFLSGLRLKQSEHRKIMTDLIAVADPQATQT
jgi:hypothetical protein